MNIFDGDYASSEIFSGVSDVSELSQDQQSVVEESQWELVQLAVSRGVMPVEQAEKMMYEFHDRIHHLGNTSLQAS